MSLEDGDLEPLRGQLRDMALTAKLDLAATGRGIIGMQSEPQSRRCLRNQCRVAGLQPPPLLQNQWRGEADASAASALALFLPPTGRPHSWPPPAQASPPHPYPSWS